jgi:hypothetical protein
MENNETPKPTPESLALDKLTAQIKSTTERLETVSDDIKVIPSLKAYGRRTRKMGWWLVASVALDILLTVIVTLGLISTHETATQLKQVQYQSCLQSNSDKAIERNVLEQPWIDFLWILVPPKKPANVSEAQYKTDEAIVKKFLGENATAVNKALAPVNCAQRYDQVQSAPASPLGDQLP